VEPLLTEAVNVAENRPLWRLLPPYSCTGHSGGCCLRTPVLQARSDDVVG